MPCQPPTARVGGAVAGSQHAGGPAGAPRKRKVRPPYNGPVRGAGLRCQTWAEGREAVPATRASAPALSQGAMDAGPGKTGPGRS